MAEVRPVIFLGIDGLDWEFVRDHMHRLPTLQRFAGQGCLSPLPSIFPPDSIPAWITIFTGQEPGEHGVVESIDYLSRPAVQAAGAAGAFLRGETFWDRASAKGLRVCVINPFMAYPAWDVNGVMVSGPVFTQAGDASVTSSLGPVDSLPGTLGGVVDFPSSDEISPFVEQVREDTRELLSFSKRLLCESRPDLMFVNILTLDRLQHFLWRYTDPADPTFPGQNPHVNAIVEGYELVDEVIGELWSAAPDSLVLVASDHGHGMRPPVMFYLDEWLRRNGFLSAGGRLAQSRTRVLDGGKRAAGTLAYRLGAEEHLESFARRLPGKKKLKTSEYSVGDASLVATARKFGRGSAGGISIRRDLDAKSCESIVHEVCAGLKELRDPSSGERIVEWARPRDEVIAGARRDVYPPILFQFDESVGVDYGLFGPLFGPDVRHRRISGGHRRNGVVAASAPLGLLPTRLSQLGDIAVPRHAA